MPDSPKTKKRLVKNPETFRERALRANEISDKPKRSDKFKRTGSKATSPLFKPIGWALNTVFDRKPFRLIGRILLPVYLRNSFRELKLVAWPNRRQSRDLTFAVLAFATVFGAVVALVDYGLDKLFKDILLK